jgi:hypothetical protein
MAKKAGPVSQVRYAPYDSESREEEHMQRHNRGTAEKRKESGDLGRIPPRIKKEGVDQGSDIIRMRLLITKVKGRGSVQAGVVRTPQIFQSC